MSPSTSTFLIKQWFARISKTNKKSKQNQKKKQKFIPSTPPNISKIEW